MDLKIEYVKTEDVKPYKNNAKIHTQEQIEQIKESIREFGMNDPIAVWKDDEVIEGHGRLIACIELGLDEVPVIRLDSLTDEQRRAYMNVHNQLTMNTGFNFELLTKELESIESIDMSQFGFDTSSMQEEQQDVIEDDYEEDVHEKPRTKRGNIYILGDHRLMCGDSTDESDVEKLMDGVKADMVFTDPPYGMNLDTDYSGIKGSKNAKIQGKGGKKYNPVIGDNDDFKPELINAIFAFFGYCDEIFTWGADYYAELLQGKNDGSWFCWDKRCSEDADKIIGNCFELCWSKKKHKKEIVRIKWMGAFGSQDARNRVHPTQKPIKLAEWFLNKYSKKNDLVVDLFGGSGSTLIACEQLNRKCYMMELDEHYCDVIVDRWEKFTGKKAILING